MNFFTRLALTSLWFIPLYGQAQGLLQKAQQLQTGVVTSSAREGLVRAGRPGPARIGGPKAYS